MASLMPKILLRGSDGSRIETKDYRPSLFVTDEHYIEYVQWLMQQIAHFETDYEGKRFVMKG